MIKDFQKIEFLKSLYSDKDLISFRGNFLKNNSNRKFSLRSFIIKLLPMLKDKKILDIGCGDGSFLNKLHTVYPQNKYFGLDVVDNAKCHKLKFLDYKIYDGKSRVYYTEKFDVIFCMHTVYHIEDLFTFFTTMKDYLKPHGIIIITTKSKLTFPKIESIFLKIVGKLDLKKYLKISKHREESKFCLENGLNRLKKHFARRSFSINEYVLETQVFVNDKKDLLKYVFSTNRYNILKDTLNKKIVEKYTKLWFEEIDKDQIFIDKYTEAVYLIKKL
ncbi:MAG: hypothetical protein A2406_01635 [Candidatus Komeilibacteria bacterium RIFOXYC1_FULL_37_11]|uniref:Uncharacterized protein n=1 Tax=Candidatus Komeilibacteria bacterium RIFOXYC1_FULL_37_11 TaxID=1798555 RepID=A0A1G2BZ24_9BACT|nr:MAG: hypothetical protein A2406_01635 [Candidatus Komeilibacteria bacterium RIFOXYC1_FULL_37_11]OGY95325.1 MAG: hypothetical protein A2611_01340 [Candidatus Komeilibacteria bacterium RIFOXYD1_FULL_37_29]